MLNLNAIDYEDTNRNFVEEKDGGDNFIIYHFLRPVGSKRAELERAPIAWARLIISFNDCVEGRRHYICNINGNLVDIANG